MATTEAMRQAVIEEGVQRLRDREGDHYSGMSDEDVAWLGFAFMMCANGAHRNAVASGDRDRTPQEAFDAIAEFFEAGFVGFEFVGGFDDAGGINFRMIQTLPVEGAQREPGKPVPRRPAEPEERAMLAERFAALARKTRQ